VGHDSPTTRPVDGPARRYAFERFQVHYHPGGAESIHRQRLRARNTNWKRTNRSRARGLTTVTTAKSVLTARARRAPLFAGPEPAGPEAVEPPGHIAEAGGGEVVYEPEASAPR